MREKKAESCWTLFTPLLKNHLPFFFFFFFRFKPLICCWLLRFYGRCLWSSMTHINGKAWVLGRVFFSSNVGLLLVLFSDELLQQLICLPVRMSRTSSSKWKTLSHFPGKPFKTSTEQQHFQGLLQMYTYRKVSLVCVLLVWSIFDWYYTFFHTRAAPETPLRSPSWSSSSVPLKDTLFLLFESFFFHYLIL